jgi:acetoin utilization deacetylase AcuC-like enzyme
MASLFMQDVFSTTHLSVSFGIASHCHKQTWPWIWALIRLPRHYAASGLAGGYFLINNVTVAAAYAKHCLGIADPIHSVKSPNES